jgi:hypothetical protein
MNWPLFIKGFSFFLFLFLGIVTKAFIVDVETEELDGPTVVRGTLSQTVGEFKATLAKALHLDPKTMKVVLEKYSSEPKLLDNDHKTLKFEGFYGANKVYLIFFYLMSC